MTSASSPKPSTSTSPGSGNFGSSSGTTTPGALYDESAPLENRAQYASALTVGDLTPEALLAMARVEEELACETSDPRHFYANANRLICTAALVQQLDGIGRLLCDGLAETAQLRDGVNAISGPLSALHNIHSALRKNTP